MLASQDYLLELRRAELAQRAAPPLQKEADAAWKVALRNERRACGSQGAGEGEVAGAMARGTLARAGGTDFEAYSFGALQVGNDLEEIAGGGIAARAKHLVQSLYVDFRVPGEPGEADRGVDVIAQELFAKRHLAGEKAFERFGKKPLAKCGIALDAGLNGFAKISGESHDLFLFFLFRFLFGLLSRLSPLVVFPTLQRKRDVVLLAPFGSPAEENDDLLAVLSEVHAVPGAEVDPALVNAGANAFDVGEVTQPDAIKSRGDLSRSLGIQRVEPLAKGVAAAGIAIFADAHHFAYGSI